MNPSINFSHHDGLQGDSTPDEFTIYAYRKLLVAALERGFHFSTYEQAVDPGRRQVWWRHDVDYSMNRGLALARVEKDFGVQATYFIDVTSPYYNIHEVSQTECLLEILSLGHQLGVHLHMASTSPHPGSHRDSMHQQLQRQARLLEELTSVVPVAFSFHNPTRRDLEVSGSEVLGLRNAYGGVFRENVHYRSDSSGYWRFGTIDEAISDERISHLQVLTHPEWWQDLPMSPRDRIARSIDGRARSGLRRYDALQDALGRPLHGAVPSFLVASWTSRGLDVEVLDFLWRNQHYDLIDQLVGSAPGDDGGE